MVGFGLAPFDYTNYGHNQIYFEWEDWLRSFEICMEPTIFYFTTVYRMVRLGLANLTIPIMEIIKYLLNGKTG